MGIFTTIFTAGLTLAGSIVQIALALLLLAIIYRIVWYIVAFVWQEIHKKSYNWFVGLFKRNKKPVNKDTSEDKKSARIKV